MSVRPATPGASRLSWRRAAEARPRSCELAASIQSGRSLPDMPVRPACEPALLIGRPRFGIERDASPPEWPESPLQLPAAGASCARTPRERPRLLGKMRSQLNWARHGIVAVDFGDHFEFQSPARLSGAAAECGLRETTCGESLGWLRAGDSCEERHPFREKEDSDLGG